MDIQVKRQNRIEWGILICIFSILIVFNWLTPYIADDFPYLFSFADGERIRSLTDIAISMAAHRRIMNGRIVAHALVQFFTLFPTVCFDLVNAGMFAVYIALMYKVGTIRQKRCPALLLAVFCLVWLYHPGIADAILWQDGAINYLWSVVFGLLFIWPYLRVCIYGDPFNRKLEKMAFLVFSFLFGAYSENVSFACIVMAALSVGWDYFQKRKWNYFLIGCIILACIGYATIYTAPAQWDNKAVGMNMVSILTSFVSAVVMYRKFGILWVLFIVLLIVNLKEKVNQNVIIQAVLFLIGSLAANFIMIFARYYAERSATGAFCFLLVAVVTLARPLIQKPNYQTATLCLIAVLAIATIPALAEATRDIGKTYIEIQQNEAYIAECKDKGILDIEVPVLTNARTDYSVAYTSNRNSHATYLQIGESQTWPNTAMAKYYGVNSLTGIVIPERVLGEEAYLP